ncbi:GNAT family N-acetyltransferase [Phycicoccus duodecadis]|uniref:RimJ/RimL family protein N-acetyltransferase n=1 Tax=Phycicoccus duodecadis TaxID=173053 RepID=A0A2N3YET3_9MICO|nr:GNAT family protein [Phycicoccus duodecadis]PKW25353.1 RimJ/RimL family protein N-acetyltransferase [Phycicoccus duodecadis]
MTAPPGARAASPGSSPVTWPRRVGDLVLRPPVESDVDGVLRWRRRPEVTRWLLRTDVDEEAMRTRLRGERDPDDHSCVVLLAGEAVGMGYLEVADGMGQDGGSAHRRAEGLLGWNLSPEVWGRGYGTAVARELLAVAFGELGLHRVTAGCFADNIASWKLMEKVGMRREQHGVQDSWHAELGWVDGYTHALLRSEWEARRSGPVAGPAGSPGASEGA